MDVEAFKGSPVGRLVPITGYDARHEHHYDHVAFVPEPLPESVDLGGATWAVVAEAMQSLGRLDQAGRQLPNPGLVRRPTIRREAVSTSALEGTYAALADVLEAETEEDEARSSPEVREVRNYVRAAEHAYASTPERGITVGLLCELQALLVMGTRGEAKDPGKVRTHQVVIGPEGALVEEARFVPPPEGDLLESGVREWERWVASQRNMPGVVQAALAHYQFETLHPFHDGNGRIGRLIIVLQLMALGALQEPILTLSPWLEARRTEYQDRLLEVSRTGGFDQWIRFFCQAVKVQAEETVRKVTELIGLQEGLRARVREANIKGLAAHIADDLIGWPIITPTFAARKYDKSYPAANAAVGRLTYLGILTELTGSHYDRVFGASEVLRIIER